MGRSGRPKDNPLPQSKVCVGAPVGSASALQKEIAVITQEWLRRRSSKKSSTPYDYASGYLKTEVYRLVLKLPKEPSEAAALVEELRGKPLRGTIPGKGVFLGLLGIIATDDQLRRAEKHRYADELLYARRHRIPVELVVGFILQVGPKLRARVKKKEHREEWFNKAKHTFKAFYH